MKIILSFQFGLITVEQADGILYTEHKVYANETLNVGYPTALVTQHVRAAHIYNISFSHVRQNFVIAGLDSYVKVLITMFFLSSILKIVKCAKKKSKFYKYFLGDHAIRWCVFSEVNGKTWTNECG